MARSCAVPGENKGQADGWVVVRVRVGLGFGLELGLG